MGVTSAEWLTFGAVALGVARAVARVRIGPGGSSRAERDIIATTELGFGQAALDADVARGAPAAWAVSEPERWDKPASAYADPFAGRFGGAPGRDADRSPVGREGKPLRIAVLGDSISHGVQARIVPRPECSWIQLIAKVLAPGDAAINTPPKLVNAPVSVERLVINVSDHGGLRGAIRTLGEARRGRAADAARAAEGRAGTMLAISGADPATLRSRPVPPRPSLPARLPWWLLRLPDPSTTARWIEESVMGPRAGEDAKVTSPLTQLVRATKEDPIDLLFVEIGANCALMGFLTLKPRWRSDLSRAADGNVWLPTLFDQEMTGVFAVLDGLVRAGGVRRVVVATVPHVVVAPAVRGFGEQDADGYFEVYRWLTQIEAKWGSGALGQGAARRIDRTIDYFNARLAGEVVRRRGEGQPWLLYDVNWILNRVAVRRAAGRTDRLGLPPYDPPDALRRPGDGQPMTTEYPDMQSTAGVGAGAGGPSLTQGGLVSLDGVHPSGAGYAVLAREGLRTLHRAGIGGMPDPDEIDRRLFAGETGAAVALRGGDPVWSDPPRHAIRDARAFRVARQILGAGDLAAGIGRAVWKARP